MKILVLSWEYPPYSVGGIASHLYDLLPQLSKLGVEVHLVTQGTEETKEYENHDGIHIYRVFTPKIKANEFSSWAMLLNFKLLEKAIAVINEHEIDLVHGHDWLVTFACQTLKHTYALPLVTTIHATEAGRNHGIHTAEQRYINDVEWWTTYEAWKVICCSQYMKNEIMGNFSLPADKIKVIGNGVDEDNFRSVVSSDFKEKYALSHEKVVYFIGRLVQEKGAQVLLDAAKEVLFYNPDAKFIISGNGPKQEELKMQADRLGISHKVEFTGHVDPKLRNSLYQIADVAVIPSLYEPFGIVALEAMITKTPVVVSDVGGLGEIINHNYDGLKSYPNDSHSLATNILTVLFDQQLAEKISTNAYQKVKEEYNWSNIAQQTLTIYEEVLSEYQITNWKEDVITI